jgi:hypothetical protein
MIAYRQIKTRDNIYSGQPGHWPIEATMTYRDYIVS